MSISKRPNGKYRSELETALLSRDEFSEGVESMKDELAQVRKSEKDLRAELSDLRERERAAREQTESFKAKMAKMKRLYDDKLKTSKTTLQSEMESKWKVLLRKSSDELHSRNKRDMNDMQAELRNLQEKIEALERERDDLVGEGAPGWIGVDRGPGQHRLQQVHVGVGL